MVIMALCTIREQGYENISQLLILTCFSSRVKYLSSFFQIFFISEKNIYELLEVFSLRIIIRSKDVKKMLFYRRITLRKRKTFPKKSFLVIPSILILAGGIAYFYVRTQTADNSMIYEEGLSRLQALENSDISQIEKQLRELEQGSKALQDSDIQETIAKDNMTLSNIELKQAFQGSVIIGDSITESIVEYGFLDTDVVISKRGLSVADASEQIETAIGLHPRNIFMAFGSNDLELYGSDSQAFIDSYRTQLKKLQEALPDSPIYINGILPIQQATIDAVPALGFYPEYNEGLKKLCQEMNCTYIDNAFIVQDNDNMYEPDGEHVVSDYYPKWLTYMAKTAGL